MRSAHLLCVSSAPAIHGSPRSSIRSTNSAAGLNSLSLRPLRQSLDILRGQNVSHGQHRVDLTVRSSSRWWYDPYEGDEGAVPYPWESEKHREVLEQTEGGLTREYITFFSTEGATRLPGRNSTRLNLTRERIQKYRESDFMDPHQKLCLGALFSIAATNKLDMGRRLCVLGFCRSVEMLSAVVGDTVREQGGEIVIYEKNTTGLLEKLHLTVSLPLLWGVPPSYELLNDAIKSGGGIVDKVYNRWEFL